MSAKKKADTLPKIKFKYLFLEDYHPEYVSGVFSSLNPSHDIVLNFFFERHGLPIEQVYNVNENGSLGEEIASARKPADLDQSFVRQVKSGVVMNLKTAIQVREQLSELISHLEKMSSDEVTGEE